ncbi:tRNA (adenosine(37)-N6)-threonylcarbamoyltransferase complex ATPase subunit type 1 TsaE [Shimia sp. SDUM112013]|uniref:tRNA (adenosine(37)-N6)-threonylcarbamoyltransferase complex ATPase subunit type 1 TsaE n=1 Tax=Shimia sp. SDUM112013 TaxID=3136160 RepID=UPI0032ECA841
MSQYSRTLALKSPEDTTRFAQELAKLLRPADIVLLEGGIGAGKTHFARSLIQSLLDQQEDVPSPTFTLVQTYETQGFEIWHADLYRLTSPDEVIELGLIDAFEYSVCLVEWPDRLADLRPTDALTLSFELSPTEGERVLTLRCATPRWKSMIGDLLNDQS